MKQTLFRVLHVVTLIAALTGMVLQHERIRTLEYQIGSLDVVLLECSDKYGDLAIDYKELKDISGHMSESLESCINTLERRSKPVPSSPHNKSVLPDDDGSHKI